MCACRVHTYGCRPGSSNFLLNVPFGGVGQSGMGRSHGFAGFQAFSNPKGILRQHTFSAIELMFPPYTAFKRKLIDLTMKYF